MQGGQEETEGEAGRRETATVHIDATPTYYHIYFRSGNHSKKKQTHRNPLSTVYYGPARDN